MERVGLAARPEHRSGKKRQGRLPFEKKMSLRCLIRRSFHSSWNGARTSSMMPPSGPAAAGSGHSGSGRLVAVSAVDPFGVHPPWEGERSELQLDRDAVAGLAVGSSQPAEQRGSRGGSGTPRSRASGIPSASRAKAPRKSAG